MPEKDKLDIRAAAILCVLCLVWGINSVAIKFGNTGIDPIFAAGLRSIIASVCLFCWMKFRKKKLFPARQIDGIVVGLLFGIEFGMLYCSMLYTSAASAFLLLYTTPFFHAIGAHMFLKNDRLSFVKLTGLILSFSGILVLMSKYIGKPMAADLIGDLLALAAAIVWAATTIYIKVRLVGKVSPHNTLFYQVVFSIPVLLVLSFIFKEAPIRQIDWLISLSIAYQGIIVAFVSYLIWFHMVHVYPVSRLSAFTFLTPIFAALAGIVLIHEPITMRLVIALVLVSAGIYVINRQ